MNSSKQFCTDLEVEQHAKRDIRNEMKNQTNRGKNARMQLMYIDIYIKLIM